MTNKNIKNEQWYVRELVSKVMRKEITKPKYQRKRKWHILYKKENTPNEQEYIKFLFESLNSVQAITFGKDGLNVSNIDGNNRINAILHFVNEPFCIFPDKLNPIFEFIEREDVINDITNENICKTIKTILTKITYNELMEFKYNKFFIEKGFGDIYNRYLKNIRDEMEPYFDELIQNMKINEIYRFDNDVKINVTLFEGYTINELANFFRDMNKYNCGLTEQEILASSLFDITNFIIIDPVLNMEIDKHINAFYIELSEDEVLSCYKPNEPTNTIIIRNAYDFMVGFQNYANEKCVLIEKPNSDGLSLFFKIFKTMYKDNFEENFTTANVNEFTDYIIRATNILKKLKTNVFMENLVAKGKIFDGCNKKLNSLSKNNMYLIIISIIGFLKKEVHENIILKSIEKCLIYHFLVHDISNKEIRETFRINATIIFEAGGKFIDNKAKEYYKAPNLISDRITKELMDGVIKHLISENINIKPYEIRSNGKDKFDKRRCRKLHEKILIYYYYTNKMPVEFLKNTFWIEHLFPFSSSWDNEIDIDRLGNILPIIAALNGKRNNNHIDEYQKLDKEVKSLRYIDDIIPKLIEYNEIITHESKKPHIFDSNKYNEKCSSNERILINLFLEKLFQ